VAQCRLCIVLAAVLWSTSGVFTNLLTQPTALGVNEPPVPARVIACCRVFFAGLLLVPLLRRRDFAFRPMMLVTGLCFALMNVLYVTALADSSKGASANAVWLQYTAPMWMYLVSVWLLGEPADRRGAVVLAVGLAGVAVILWGGWQSDNLLVVAIALGSGVAFAGVMIGLRVLRDVSSRWLTVFDHLFGALVLLPFLWGSTRPTAAQLVVLFFFGGLQMSLPYWLVARGLRSVSPQEAGTIILLEPLLTPVWAYLVAPEKETPTGYTLAGGALILGALAWRYWPFRSAPAEQRG
jgi:drug/metabolite transporter (DMT)-like permease